MDDDGLLKKIRAGGAQRRQAVGELFHSYAPRLRRYFRKNGASEELADDMVQDVFVNIVRHCGTYRADADFEVWLWKIARNRLIDFYRRPRPVMEPIAPDCEPPADDLEEQELLRECVRDALARFGLQHPDRASALNLAALEGWSTTQLAGLLDRSPGATREFLSQCRKALQPFLAPCRDYLSAEC